MLSPWRAAPSTVNHALQMGWNLPVIREFVSQVLESRRTHANLEQAIVQHEAQALVTGEAETPGPSGRSSRRGRRRGSGRSNVTRNVNRSDLTIRPPAPSLPRSVPRSILNQVLWDVVTVQSGATLSLSSVTENNFAPTLNNHPQATAWTTICDQWCIPQFSVKIISSQPPGSTSTTVPICYTAIDFDSINTLGSTASILAFDNCRAEPIVDNKTIVRSCRPCVKTNLGGVNSSGLSRQWCDCATTTTPWFGIRTMFNAVASGGTVFNVAFELTIWFAFRNRI